MLRFNTNVSGPGQNASDNLSAYSGTSMLQFSKSMTDEICTINFDGTHTGKGQISATDSNTIFIQHTSGDVLTSNTVTISNTSFIYGTESGVNTVFTSANLVVSNLRAEEESYWTPVTYFDYENEKNEFNKTILVLDPKFTQTTVQNLTDLMKE